MDQAGKAEGHSTERTVTLATGQLHVQVLRSALELDQLCGFAARRNPRRPFLFVSRVLGRHLPVRPSVMRDVHERLAQLIDAGTRGPVLFIGLAETATALGQGVFTAWVRRTGREDVACIHSTRYRFREAPAFGFEEEHSHATRHLVHRPRARAEVFDTARTLVLVDDELTSGRTFDNLAAAYARVNPHLERVIRVVITDWRPEQASEAEVHSLLRGTWRFTRSAEPPKLPDVRGRDEPKDELVVPSGPRFGEVLSGTVNAMAETLPTGRTLVLGTGEFTFPPFLLAERLEQAGADVWCQATTRSPVMVGNDVATALEFRDNYGDGIPNYLYNVTPGQYDRVLVCHETARDTLCPTLLSALQADTIDMRP